MGEHRTRSLMLGLALWLVPGAARADVVPVPTHSCPHGGYPVSCHGDRALCAADDCLTDSDCAGGQTCEDLLVCIIKTACGRPGPGDASLDDLPDFVENSCAVVGATCSDRYAASSCQSRRMCRGTATGCGCKISPSARAFSGGLLAFGIAAAAALLRRHRWRRK
jgi:hypothetical protein